MSESEVAGVMQELISLLPIPNTALGLIIRHLLTASK
jgi:hypothetical protein